MTTAKPVEYSEEVVEEIIERMQDGEPLRHICRDPHMPHRRTVMHWKDKREDFGHRYARARVEQGHAALEMVVEIGLGGRCVADPQAARVQLDALKWAAVKLAPRDLGDEVRNKLTGPDGEERAKVEHIHRWER
jgi:hypothetical protein